VSPKEIMWVYGLKMSLIGLHPGLPPQKIGAVLITVNTAYKSHE